MGNKNARGRISARRAATFLAALGALVMSSGMALMVTAGPATAGGVCEPSQAWTQETDWVDQSPGDGWRQIDERSVMTSPGTDAVYTLQRYSWNPQGPVDESTADPTWPATQGKWTANTSAYSPGHDGEPIGVPFQQANGNNGDNGSWFYWDKVIITPATSPVWQTQYKFAFDHPAVTCDEPLVATATATPNTPTCADTVPTYTKSGANIRSDWQQSAAPAFNTTITVTATAVPGAEFAGGDTTESIQVTFPAAATGCATQVSPPQTEATVVVSTPKTKATTKTKTKAAAVTPTVVEAGLAGTSTKDLRGEQGLALMVAGMVMLVGAGGLRLRVRGVASRI